MDATPDHYLQIILNMSLFCPLWVIICPVTVVMAVHHSIRVENSLISIQDSRLNGKVYHFLLCCPLTKLLMSVAVIPMKFLQAYDLIRIKFLSLQNAVNGYLTYSCFLGSFLH
jgi:hypothetical protein